MVFQYLIAHRLRPKPFSYVWFKVWGKRVVHYSPAISLPCCGMAGTGSGRACALVSMAGIGPCEITGNRRNLKVGDFSFVGRATIQLLGCVRIGHSVVINDDVTILTGTHDVNDEHFQLQTKPVVIGNYAWICTSNT